MKTNPFKEIKKLSKKMKNHIKHCTNFYSMTETYHKYK